MRFLSRFAFKMSDWLFEEIEVLSQTKEVPLLIGLFKCLGLAGGYFVTDDFCDHIFWLKLSLEV